jgi:hypothetical protein
VSGLTEELWVGIDRESRFAQMGVLGLNLNPALVKRSGYRENARIKPSKYITAPT